MNNGKKPSFLVREVFLDSDAVENRWKVSIRLKDRKLSSVHSSSEPQTQQQNQRRRIPTIVQQQKKLVNLKKGVDEVFVNATALLATRTTLQESPSARKRLEERRLNEFDVVEIPKAASQGEIEKVVNHRPRARRENLKDDPTDDTKEKGQSSSDIGEQYQASVHTHLRDEDQIPTDFSSEQLWDSQKAATLPPEELERYLDQSKELNVKMLLLEALHIGNYDLEQASRIFYKMHAQRQDLSVTFDEAEHVKFDELCRGPIIGTRKDFREAARLMNRPIGTVLVQYYVWKAKNRPIYNAMKNKRRIEPEECSHCKDGGLLIVCNSCCRAFHLECLQPQLQVVPEGDWFCSLCTHHSPSRLRRPTNKNDNCTATKLGFDRPGEKTPPTLLSRLQSLKSAHKEFSFLSPQQERDGNNMHSRQKRDKVLEASPASSNVYGNLHSDDDYDDEKTKKKKFKASPLKSGDGSTKGEPDSDYKSDENEPDEIDDDFLDADVVETPSKKHKSAAVASVGNAPYIIDVILPICPGGFRVMLGSSEDGSIIFMGYAHGSQGEKGYAEACNLFRSGDIITHVDGNPCERDIQRAISLLRTPLDIGIKAIRIMRSSSEALFPIPLSRFISMPNGSSIFTFLLPVLPEGFLIQLVEAKTLYGDVCTIDGSKTKNGKKGFAGLHNLFRQGDVVVEIDGRSCFGLKFMDIVMLFKKESTSGWRSVKIQRWSKSTDNVRKGDDDNATVEKGSNITATTDLVSTEGKSGVAGEHGSNTKNALPSVTGSTKDLEGNAIPDVHPNPAQDNLHTSNPRGVQAHSSIPQPPQPFRNGVAIASTFQSNIFQPSSYQSIQSNQFPYGFPLSNLQATFQPAWGRGFSKSSGNGSNS